MSLMQKLSLSRGVQTWLWPMLSLTALVILLGVSGSPSLQAVAQLGLVYLVLTVGYYTFVGNSGIISFGHMAFMGVGAYTVALLAIPVGLKKTLLPDVPEFITSTQLGFVTSIIVAGSVSALLALVIGPVLMRMSGLSAGIATLALLLIAQVVISESEGWTRGPQTLIGIPSSMSLWGALCIVLVISAIAILYQYSRSGRLLRASRDDYLAAESIGISLVRHRVGAFALSAGICGAGGGMLAFYQQSLSPSMSFFLAPTFSVIVMLIIGGMYSFNGAVVGVVIVSVAQEILRQFSTGVEIGGFVLMLPVGTDAIVLGLATLVMLTIRPGGLLGMREWVIGRLLPSDDEIKNDSTAFAEHEVRITEPHKVLH